MWIVAIAWMYVAVMMSLTEATAPNGSVLGAIFTFLFYGVLPVTLVMYLLGTPARRKARRAAEAAARDERNLGSGQPESPHAPNQSAQPDAGGLPSGGPIAPEREKP